MLELHNKKKTFFRKKLLPMHCFLMSIVGDICFRLRRDVWVAVALEVAARGRAVLLPALQADPAEVVATLGALDVVAAVRLLDGGSTVRARFRVGDQPKKVCGVIVTAFWRL
jgi:hypothetical protein